MTGADKPKRRRLVAASLEYRSDLAAPYVSAKGEGEAATDESIGLALLLVAQQMAINEARDAAVVPSALRTYHQRVARYGAEVML